MIANNRTMTFPLVKSAYPWLIVCCGMLFYCYNYFLRVSPSVMQVELTQAFHITATQFGTLAGLYYWAYTPMQIPAGIVYDKFGVRFVLCVACLIAVIGLSVFTSSNNYMAAGTGRFMIGLGCAFAYIGTLKLASIWLPPNRFATVAGLTTAVGMTSGALAQKYLTHVVETIGYQASLRSALAAGVVLSIIIIMLVRNRPSAHTMMTENKMQTPINIGQFITALHHIFTNPQMWLIGIIGCLLYLPSSVFLDLWGIPYLKAVYHLTSEQAVAISSYTFFGWIISGPIIGLFSDTIRRRRVPLTVTGFFAALLLCVVFYVPGISLSELYTIFFMIGFCCGAHPLCFALGKENNPIQISGTAVAVTNMLIMAGGAIFQPVVGKLLDLHTTSSMSDAGLPIYSSSDYTFALSIVPIGVALGIFLSIFLKETYCETREEVDENISNSVATESSSEALSQS
ncbi:MAG: MFS transporter [Gammaproteobacteria bacterium]|nr:MFS transporter [Gammaproteobacteria bacterium]MCW5583494.1 MFS transporter [Gammaproteobacteria bacterium]